MLRRHCIFQEVLYFMAHILQTTLQREKYAECDIGQYSTSGCSISQPVQGIKTYHPEGKRHVYLGSSTHVGT